MVWKSPCFQTYPKSLSSVEALIKLDQLGIKGGVVRCMHARFAFTTGEVASEANA